MIGPGQGWIKPQFSPGRGCHGVPIQQPSECGLCMLIIAVVIIIYVTKGESLQGVLLVCCKTPSLRTRSRQRRRSGHGLNSYTCHMHKQDGMLSPG